jgi:hypothetical protein
MKALVDCHLMESGIWASFLALVGGFGLVKKLAPVVVVSLGNFGILLFFTLMGD